MDATTRGLWAGAVLAGLVGGAHALSITDTYTPESTVVLRTGVSYSYQHDLLRHGFDPLADTLTAVTLTLGMSGPGGQRITVTLDGVGGFEGPLKALLGDEGDGIVPLNALQSDGLLDVALLKGGGLGSRFVFTESILAAQWNRGGAGDGSTESVSEQFRLLPEPSALALVGLGLVGAFAIHQTPDIRGWIQPIRIPEVLRKSGLRLIRSRRLIAGAFHPPYA